MLFFPVFKGLSLGIGELREKSHKALEFIHGGHGVASVVVGGRSECKATATGSPIELRLWALYSNWRW
ncbi:hypothetical protein XpopCFBP1817_11430 [Xanthomonas populi]|uniref:Uncharacterized protein n=1 Tax=Xanthomonas populi TaxID=53414 RepID=A0A2S7ENK3_9XANT|nr:hypothetical protein XpopCFBP1817_11430 [Xanthomonas populi]